MTTTKKLFSFFALAVLIGLASCNDNDGPNQLSKDDAKGEIAEFNNTASGDISDFADADGVQAIKDFFNLVDTDDPFNGRTGTDRKKVRAFFHKKGHEFKSIFIKNGINGRTSSDEPFDFDSNAGVYAWNPELGDFGGFEKIDESEIIIIQFPTAESLTNNAELRLTAYDEVEFFDEEFQEYTYEPTVLNASISVNEQEVAALDLNIDWTNDGFPLGAAITLEVAPYKAVISFDDSGTTSSSVSLSFLKNQDVLVATTINVKYSDSDKNEENLASIEGFVQFRELSIQGSINVEAADQAEVDWNEVVKLQLFKNSDKLGDIIFVEENDEPVPYLQYSDGSKEKLETVLQPVIDEIDELTDDLDNNG